jgi:hypothetical protein
MFEDLNVDVVPEWPNMWEDMNGKTVEAAQLQADHPPSAALMDARQKREESITLRDMGVDMVVPK